MEKETDVVIIGAGISGCATAYNLAKRGTRVVVIDKQGVASEASGRTMAAIRQHGRHPAEMSLMREAIKIWGRLDEELGYETEFVQGGNLIVAEDDKHLERLAEYERLAKEAEVDSRLLTYEEVKKLVPSLEYPVRAALYSPGDGHCNPVKATVGFAKVAEERGARFYSNTVALGIETTAGRVSSVTTDKGEIKTPVVVNAAGIWANRVARMVGLYLPIKVTVSHVGETEPLPPLFKTFLWMPKLSCRQTASGTLRFGGGYLGVRDHYIGLDSFDNLGLWLPRLLRFRRFIRLVFNGSHLWREIRRDFPLGKKDRRLLEFAAGWEPRANNRYLSHQAQILWQRMPGLKGTKIMRTWAGLNGLTADLLPIMGRVEHPDGFFVVCFPSHGFAPGPVTGKLVSELILNGKTSIPIDAFNPMRFYKKKAVAMPSDVL
ncbi:MAG: FAD-binding oxidoreductase [Chloroflexi bacterium]|nr:FAD-binding oxidoreductase [Chloroflexota bacterium]